MAEAPEVLHTPERRLAAILAADIAGYSRLMGQDEAATVRDLKAHQAVVLPMIGQFGGNIIDTAGDGILAQFPSAVRAVECAVAVQKLMGERNFDVPEDRRMQFRIGVNLGDIIHDGNRVYGDGINVAARLETVTEPGGICLSANVREAIFGKLGLPLRDLGEKTFKNIARPVRAFEVQPEGTRVRRAWPRLRPGLAAMAFIAVLAGAGFGAWRLWPRDPPDYMPPTIAVLPFANTSGDPAENMFASSLAEELSAYLATFPTMRIVSTAGVAAAKLADPRGVAQELGAVYLVEGEVFKTAQKARITVQVISVGTGESLWSNHYDFEGADALAIQARVSQRVYDALGGVNGKIRKLEEETAWRKPEHDLTDSDYDLRAESYQLKNTLDDLARARQIAEEGLARFPGSAELNVRIAWTYVAAQINIGPFADCHEKFALARKFASEADRKKTKSRLFIWRMHRLMAQLYQLHGGDLDRSAAEAEAAVEMAPYDAELRSDLSYTIAGTGKLDEAIEWASWVLDHDQHNVSAKWYKPNLAWALYLAGRYEEALDNLKGAEMLVPDIVAAVSAHLGRLDDARAVVAAWLKRGSPSIATQACWAIREPLKTMYLDDLRKAGLPEK